MIETHDGKGKGIFRTILQTVETGNTLTHANFAVRIGSPFATHKALVAVGAFRYIPVNSEQTEPRQNPQEGAQGAKDSTEKTGIPEIYGQEQEEQETDPERTDKDAVGNPWSELEAIQKGAVHLD